MMADWESILTGLLAIGLVIWMWPRVRQQIKHGPKAQAGDWASLMPVLLAVVGFVLLLILMI